MSLVYTNNAQSTLQSAISDIDTTLTVYQGDGALFPDISVEDSDWFPLTLINPDDSTYEIVRAIAREGDVITIDRAQENTPVASAFDQGTIVSLRMSSAGYDEFSKSGNENLTVQLGLNLAVQTNASSEPYELFLEGVSELKDNLLIRFNPVVSLSENPGFVFLKLNDLDQKRIDPPYGLGSFPLAEGDFRTGVVHELQYSEERDVWHLLSPTLRERPAALLIPGLATAMFSNNQFYDSDSEPEAQTGYPQFTNRRDVSRIIDDFAEKKGLLDEPDVVQPEEAEAFVLDASTVIPGTWRWYGNAELGDGFVSPNTRSYGSLREAHYKTMTLVKDQKLWLVNGTGIIRATEEININGILIATTAANAGVRPTPFVGPLGPGTSDFNTPTKSSDNSVEEAAPLFLDSQQSYTGGSAASDTSRISAATVLGAIRENIPASMFHGAHGLGFAPNSNQTNSLYYGRGSFVLIAPKVVFGDDAITNIATMGTRVGLAGEYPQDYGNESGNSLSSQAAGGMLIIVTEDLTISDFAEFLCADPAAVPKSYQDALADLSNSGVSHARFRGAEPGAVFHLHPVTGVMLRLF